MKLQYLILIGLFFVQAINAQIDKETRIAVVFAKDKLNDCRAFTVVGHAITSGNSEVSYDALRDLAREELSKKVDFSPKSLVLKMKINRAWGEYKGNHVVVIKASTSKEEVYKECKEKVTSFGVGFGKTKNEALNNAKEHLETEDYSWNKDKSEFKIVIDKKITAIAPPPKAPKFNYFILEKTKDKTNPRCITYPSFKLRTFTVRQKFVEKYKSAVRKKYQNKKGDLEVKFEDYTLEEGDNLVVLRMDYTFPGCSYVRYYGVKIPKGQDKKKIIADKVASLRGNHYETHELVFDETLSYKKPDFYNKMNGYVIEKMNDKGAFNGEFEISKEKPKPKKGSTGKRG